MLKLKKVKNLETLKNLQSSFLILKNIELHKIKLEMFWRIGRNLLVKHNSTKRFLAVMNIYFLKKQNHLNEKLVNIEMIVLLQH